MEEKGGEERRRRKAEEEGEEKVHCQIKWIINSPLTVFLCRRAG